MQKPYVVAGRGLSNLCVYVGLFLCGHMPVSECISTVNGMVLASALYGRREAQRGVAAQSDSVSVLW